MSLYKNRYRIESIRLKNWDYSSDGYYFITICTKYREHLFGEIINNKINLSDIGKIVFQEWNKSFDIRAELFCDCFVIMPNHIHGVLRINISSVETHAPVETHAATPVETHAVLSLQGRGHVPKSISSFVAGFKSHATKQINGYRNTPGGFVWQPRFHDHVIRNNGELNRIRKYINNNPCNWKEDNL